MKIAVTKEWEEAVHHLDKINDIDQMLVIDSIDDVQNTKVQAVIADRAGMTAPDLLTFREKHPRLKIMLIFDQSDDIFRKACITHNVDIIESTKLMDISAIQTIVQHRWFHVEEKSMFQNVLAIMGTHRQVGVTQTAWSLASLMHEYGRRVGVFGLNPYNPGEFPNENEDKLTYSFEQVYHMIENGMLDEKHQLTEYMKEKNGFYYLVGNRDYYKAPTFKKEPIEQLILKAKKEFDVVLLDVGSFYDGFMALTSLSCADTHLLVSTQEYIASKEYQRWKKQFLNQFDIGPKYSYLIVNKYASRATITPKQLEQELNVPLLGQVPFFPNANDVELATGLLVEAQDKLYNRAIKNIVKALLEEVEDTLFEKKKKVGLLSMFGR